MASWPIQDARVRFDELLQASKKDGPQTVTEEGVEAAVLVPIDEWRRVNKSKESKTERPKKYATLDEWLLAPEPIIEDLDEIIGPRRNRLHARRPPVQLPR
jgi:prevent-host-death family protein